MSRELDLQALRLIVALEAEGSLGRAAALLGISQPAASICLKAFETRWQVVVAERSARGTVLTHDGTTIGAWAREVLHQVDTMRRGLEALTGPKAGGGDVDVAASLTVAEFLLPRWIGELRTQAPDTHLQVQVVNSELVADLVESGRCELGFIETAAVPERLARQRVGLDRLVIVVARQHPWARRSTPLTRADLLKEEYVLREQGSGTRDTFERALRARPEVAMIATSTAAMVGAVIARVGPAVVTPRAVTGAVETGQIAVVPHDLDLARPLTAVWRQGASLGAGAERLLRIASLASRAR